MTTTNEMLDWAADQGLAEQERNGKGPPRSSLLTSPTRKWPTPMAAEAFYGLAGDVVWTIEPLSLRDSG